MSDELRNQIRSLDPMHPGVQTTSPSQSRLEDIMTSTPTTTPRPAPTRWYAAAAVAAVAIVVAIPALTGDEAPAPVATAPLQLSLGEGDAMASCMMFDVAILADMPVAFEGTATSVEGELVTLTVDHWYKGGDAATVELTAPGGLVALIGGIDFVAGDTYLITASDGVVNYCGYTGPSTPEFRASFDTAFGS
jgi:hypothetical protein